MKIFVTSNFGDRDYMMKVISSPYVIGNEIKGFSDENFLSP